MNKRVEIEEYYRLYKMTESAGRYANNSIKREKKKKKRKEKEKEKTNKIFSINNKQCTLSLGETLRRCLEQGHPHQNRQQPWFGGPE